MTRLLALGLALLATTSSAQTTTTTFRDVTGRTVREYRFVAAVQ